MEKKPEPMTLREFITQKPESLPAMSRSATFTPSTFDAKSRTAEMVWTTGARVKRDGFFDSWFEELSLAPGSVRLERLNGGAPVLKNHNARDLSNVIGVVERAWVENGEGRATVRFSEREDVQPIIQDIQSGILRSVSVGYKVHRFEEVQVGENETAVFRAVDWEPLEISVVTIPADATAGFRAEELKEQPAAHQEREQMDIETKKPEPKVDIELVRKEAIEAERARSVGIMEAVRKAKLEESFAHEMIAAGVSIDEARAKVIDKLAEAAPAINPTVRVSSGTDERDNLLAGAESALLNRFNGAKYALEERGKKFYGRSLVETARIFVEAKGEKTEGMSPGRIAERALHSSTDFPILLANVANKVLKAEYAEVPATYSPIVREAELPDYKEKTILEMTGKLKMESLLEGGEYRRGTFGEGKDSYSLADYGKLIGVTRKTIINDDLNVFSRVPGLFGRACRDLEQDLVWEIIGANGVIGDGKALFHAAHGNLGTAAPISIESMSAARKAMRTQKDPAGNLVALRAQYLIVPAALETKAQQFLAQTSPQINSEVNPFAGSLQIIVEPRLDAYSETAWYLAASPSTIDGIEVGYLAGERGPQMASREGFEIEGMEIKCRLTVAVKCWNHRGFYKNPGA